MATLIHAAEAQERLKDLPGWSLNGNQIQTTRKFSGFPEAIAFVNQLVAPAEAAGHHPDLSISYNKVTIALTSHDAGGLTEADFNMARTIADL